MSMQYPPNPDDQPPSQPQPNYPQQPQQSYPTYPSGPMQQQPYQPYPSGPMQPGQVPMQPQQPLYVQPMQPYGAGYVQPLVQTTYTRSASFTLKAVLAFLLYFLFWIPGLIFNIMFLNEANNVKREIGRTPEGMGCLWASLVWGIIPLGVFGFCALSILVSALGAGSSAGQ